MAPSPNATYLRRDTSGVLSSRLAAVLAEGEALAREAALIGDAIGRAEFRRQHRLWVLRCLRLLAEGFEPEAVTELVHVSKPVTDPPTPTSRCSAPAPAIRDALELLRGLRETLHRDDRP